jgi:Tripartite ATP-independent periplasmic transporter, DctM component
VVLQVGLILLVMAGSYGLAKWKLSVELSMLAAALAGVLSGAVIGTPHVAQVARHLVEGAFTYLDVVLIFVTATIFMEIVNASGGVSYIVKGVMRRFGSQRVLVLLMLMLILLIPGALTGAGSVSLLVVGTPVALALAALGIKPNKVAAILFIVAGLSAVAPPVNIWAMITCAGTAIPYVGFDLPLLIPVLLLGSFTVLFLGWKGTPVDIEETLKELPAVPKEMRAWRVGLPFLVFFGFVLSYRLWPFTVPIMGLPLQFVLSAVVAVIVSPKRVNVLALSRKTVKRLLPLLSIAIIVGVLQQVMTVTGVRGLVSFAAISTPLLGLYFLLPLIIPMSEGVLTYGGAAVLGIPLIWYFDSIGLHATVAIAGLSLLWALGDGLPPTALIGRLSVMVSKYDGSYRSFLKGTWIPWIVITAVGVLMVVFSAKLSFLVR